MPVADNCVQTNIKHQPLQQTKSDFLYMTVKIKNYRLYYLIDYLSFRGLCCRNNKRSLTLATHRKHSKGRKVPPEWNDLTPDIIASVLKTNTSHSVTAG